MLRDKIARVALINVMFLIIGATGPVRKPSLARSIGAATAFHSLFVAGNYAAFTDTLLEGEWFGHERSAFTGADHTREDLFRSRP